MNIAFFTESYKPYISGVTVSVETLSQALRKKGHSTFIFAPSYKDEKVEEGVFRLPSIPTAYPGFRIAIPFSPNIRRTLQDLKIDIIHSHSPFQLGLLGRSLARKLGIPFIYTLHTLFDQYLHYIPLLPAPISKRMMIGHLRSFCNSSSRVIVPSKYVKDLAVREGVNVPIEVVPTGIDLEGMKGFRGLGIRERYSIPKTSPLLLYVGRLSKEKNIPFLFEAMRKVFDASPNARLLIAAGGPEEARFKSLAGSLGIGARVIFAGQISRPEIFNYYAAADIFTFASVTETQGLVISEAAGMGLPIVAVDAAGISGSIENGKDGFLLPQEESIFAGKVLLLIQDEAARKTMAHSARAHAAADFSAEAYANGVEKVYEEVLY